MIAKAAYISFLLTILVLVFSFNLMGKSLLSPPVPASYPSTSHHELGVSALPVQMDWENEIWVDEDSNIILVTLPSRNIAYSIRSASVPVLIDSRLEAYLDYQKGDKMAMEYKVFLTFEVSYLITDDTTAFPVERLISLKRGKVRDLIREKRRIQLPTQTDIDSSFANYCFNGWEQNCHGWSLLCTLDPASRDKLETRVKLWINNEIMTEIINHDNLSKIEPGKEPL